MFKNSLKPMSFHFTIKYKTWERWSLTGTWIGLIEINRIYLTDIIPKEKS